MNGCHLQPTLLDQQGKAADRIEVKVDALLFDVLITELVGQPKRIMIAWILLIEGAVPLWVGVRVPGSIVIFPTETRPPGQVLRAIAGLDVSGGSADRIVREAAPLQRCETVIVESTHQATHHLETRRHLRFRSGDALPAGHSRKGLHEYKWLNRGVRHPCLKGADRTVKSEPGAVRVQRRGMHYHHRAAE